MNFGEKGFGAVMLLVIIAGIFVVGGGWYFLAQKTSSVDTLSVTVPIAATMVVLMIHRLFPFIIRKNLKTYLKHLDF